MTAMARKGDISIEVTDPDRKFIVIQESLIYLAEGKGFLILERPLSRDFLAGTPVRPQSDVDQHWTIMERFIFTILTTPILIMRDREIELDGTGGDPHLGDGEAAEVNQAERLPCGKTETSFRKSWSHSKGSDPHDVAAQESISTAQGTLASMS